VIPVSLPVGSGGTIPAEKKMPSSRSRPPRCHGAFLLALLASTSAYAESGDEPMSRMSAEVGFGYSLVQVGSDWDYNYKRYGFVERVAVSVNMLPARLAHRVFVGVSADVTRTRAFVDGVVVQAAFVGFARPELRLTPRLPLFAYAVVGVGVGLGHQFIPEYDQDCDCELTDTALLVRTAIGAKVVLGHRWTLWLEPLLWDVALRPGGIYGLVPHERYSFAGGATLLF
jgi:hypothetical protein